MHPKKGQSPESVLAHVGLTEKVEAIELFIPDCDSDTYLVTLNVKLDHILQVCKNLAESGLCYFAEPDFVMLMAKLNTYFPDQWGFKNTNQYYPLGAAAGFDIRAELAWAITRGSPTI